MLQAIPYEDYGLVLTKQELGELYISKHPEEFPSANDFWSEYTEDPDPFWESMYNEGVLNLISGFTGDACKVRNDGNIDENQYIPYEDDSVFYVALLELPTLFHAPYDGMSAIISEMEDRLGQYLPDDFDYAAHLYKISGVYYTT